MIVYCPNFIIFRNHLNQYLIYSSRASKSVCRAPGFGFAVVLIVSACGVEGCQILNLRHLYHLNIFCCCVITFIDCLFRPFQTWPAARHSLRQIRQLPSLSSSCHLPRWMDLRRPRPLRCLNRSSRIPPNVSAACCGLAGLVFWDLLRVYNNWQGGRNL